MYSEFEQRSRPYFNDEARDQWDTMFNMQHYGVPTRLLDWSESPFVALFFALKPYRGGYKEDVHLWMCDPEQWNRALVAFASTEFPILDKSHRRLRDYGYGLNIDNYRDDPLMVNGSYNSPRLVAQRGGFTLFGRDLRPLEDIFDQNDKIPRTALEKIVIKAADCPGVFESLVRKGFTETFVYPDIFGLADEVTRKYGLSDA